MPVPLLAFIPLIFWRLYARLKALIGRQASRSWRHWSAAVIFPLVLMGLLLIALPNARAIVGVVGGVAIGTAVGVLALRRTRFEVTPEGLFYTPNKYIGGTLSSVLIVFVLVRTYEHFFAAGATGPPSWSTLWRTPLAMLVFAAFAAYYATFAIGLIRWRRREGKAAVAQHLALQEPQR